MSVGFTNLAVGQKVPEHRRRGGLAKLATRGLDALVERDRRAEQRFQRHCAGDVSALPEAVCVNDRERRRRRVRLGTVDEDDPFFRAELDGPETVLPQHIGGRTTPVAVPQLALADQREREMRQWSQVAAGPDAALLRYRRMQTPAQHTAGTAGARPARAPVGPSE